MNDYQRQQARERLDRKFYKFDHNIRREWRDNYEALSDIPRRMAQRKVIGQRVSNILKAHKQDGIRVLAEIDRISRNERTTISFLRSVISQNYGEDVFSNFRWRDHWVHPVWVNEPWFKDSIWAKVHQVHQSEDNPSQIAYNRSIDNIKRNIQTRTKPGKYLTQFFSDVLDQDEIREWAEKQIAFASCEAELKFVENDDPDGWERVYTDGPQSCMRGSDSVRVYCYPDNGLRLAYLQQGDDIVARAIVREGDANDVDAKGYIRLYATEQRWTTALKESLASAGYDKQTYLNGVKLRRINEDHDGRDGVVCPYIDCGNGGGQGIDIYDNYLKVVESGEVTATYTGGTIPLFEGRECDCCGSNYDEDDMTYVESTDETVCEHCLNEHYTYAYTRRGNQDYFPEGDCIYCESDSEWYHQEYANQNDVYQCRVSDDWYHIDDLVTCDCGQYEGDLIHCDEAVNTEDGWCYSGDCTEIDGTWISNDHVVDCHVTGDSIDIRKAVCIELHNYVNNWGHRLTKRIYVGYESWTSDNIVYHFVRCGDLLLPNTYYGVPITTCFEPTNVEYGDEFTCDKCEELLAEDMAEAA